MKRYLTLFLIFLNYHSLEAQSSTLRGEFLYQKNEKFKIEQVENAFLETSTILIDTISDDKGRFEINFRLDEPQTILLRSSHGLFRLFLHPNDTLDIKMLNKWSIKFNGKYASENNWLFKSNRLEWKEFSVFTNESTWSDLKQLAQIRFDENLASLDSLKPFASEDFYHYIYSEFIAEKYLQWLYIRNQKTVYQDLSARYYMDGEIKKFFGEDVYDKKWAKAFETAVYRTRSLLPIDMGDTSDRRFSSFENDTIQSLLKYYSKFPNLSESLLFTATNYMIGKTYDSLDLEKAELLVNNLKASGKQKATLEKITIYLNEVKRMILLKRVHDFNIWNEKKELISFSSLVDTNLHVDFSKLEMVLHYEKDDQRRRELYSLVKNSSYNAVDIRIVAGCSFESWLDFMEKNKEKLTTKYYYLDSTELQKVKTQYYFTTLPFNFEADKNGTILNKFYYLSIFQKE